MNVRRAVILAMLLTPLCLVATAAASPAAGASDSGDLLWTHSFPFTANQDAFYDVARLPDGGVVAVGITDVGPMGTGGDAMIVRYSAAGALLMSIAYDDGDGRPDMFTDVVVDRSGNMYAAGQHETATGTSDILVVKFTKSGATPWVASLDGGAAGSDMAYDVVVDRSGNPRVIGIARIWGGVDQLFVAKLSGNTGAEVWRTTEPGPAGSVLSLGASGALAGDGSLYVAGQVQNGSGVWRSLMVKLKPSGAVAWSRAYKPSGTTTAYGQIAALDPGGRPWLLAQVSGPAQADLLLVRYSTAGGRTMQRRFGFPGDRKDYPIGMAIDGAGRIFVSGDSQPAATTEERGFLVSYTMAGALRFARLYPEMATRTTHFATLLVDGTGGAYVAGSMRAPGLWTNRFIVHYGAGGSRVWTRRTANPIGDDGLMALARCGSAGIAAVGWVQVIAGDADAIVEKYRK